MKISPLGHNKTLRQWRRGTIGCNISAREYRKPLNKFCHYRAGGLPSRFFISVTLIIFVSGDDTYALKQTDNVVHIPLGGGKRRSHRIIRPEKEFRIVVVVEVIVLLLQESPELNLPQLRSEPVILQNYYVGSLSGE